MNLSKDLNLSQELIGEMGPLKTKPTNSYNSVQSEIEGLKKENLELQHSIFEMSQ